MTYNILKQIIKNTAEPDLIHHPEQRFSLQVNIDLEVLFFPYGVPSSSTFPQQAQDIFTLLLQSDPSAVEEIVG
ncbi:hypothetical protein D3C76_1802770 [compost metagenome]